MDDSEADSGLKGVDEMRCLFPEDYLTAFLSAGVRPDGRKMDGGRQVTLNVGCVSTANGSALVRFGDTLVVCGVKAELVVTSPTSFDKRLVCNVEVPPCSSSSVSPGPPTMSTQSLSQSLQTTFFKCVDGDQLMIDDGKFHWVLYVDILCLCDDGNLLDSACLAATAALKTTHLPKVDVSSAELPIVSLKHSSRLKLTSIPLFVSFALLANGSCLMDPSIAEEEVAVGRLSFCLVEDTITQLTHTGVGLSPECILSLGKSAQQQTRHLLKLLHKAIQ